MVNNDGSTLLMCAVICGMKKLAERILKKINIHNLNFQNKHFDNILMICISLQYFELVDIILDFEEIDVNIINKYGDTPLILLLNFQKFDLVKKILDNDCMNIDHVSDSGLCAREMLIAHNIFLEYLEYI
jgi:ankyrin repeat protein